MPLIDLLTIDPGSPVVDAVHTWGSGTAYVRDLEVGDLVRVWVFGLGPYFAITAIHPGPDGTPETIEAVYGRIYESPNLYNEIPQLTPGLTYSFPANRVYEIPKPVLMKHHMKDAAGQKLFPKDRKEKGGA